MRRTQRVEGEREGSITDDLARRTAIKNSPKNCLDIAVLGWLVPQFGPTFHEHGTNATVEKGCRAPEIALGKAESGERFFHRIPTNFAKP